MPETQTFLDRVRSAVMNGIRFDEAIMPEDAVSLRLQGRNEHSILVLAADGTGIVFFCRENRWTPTDYFSHEGDIATMKALPDEERDDAILAFFAKHVNPHLGDPLLLEDDVLADSSYFVCGSAAELIRLATLIVQTEPGFVSAGRKAEVRFYGLLEEDDMASNIDAVRTWHITGIEPTQRLKDLMEIAQDLNEFHGTSYYYNDGRAERMSGYTAERNTIHIAIEPPSGHEAMTLHQQLRDALASQGFHAPVDEDGMND